MSKLFIKVEPMVDADIQETLEEMVRLSSNLWINVQCKFNDVTVCVYARPESQSQRVKQGIEDYYKVLGTKQGIYI